MRIDHHAYQRATRVAGLGLLTQIAIGVLLMVLGLVATDTIFQFASLYILIGVVVWTGLVIIFNQHKLERLESLEEDELAATRGGAGSFFDNAGDESKVAARRLAMMHTWLMPIFSLVVALALAGLATWMLMFMKWVRTDVRDFHLTEHRGWAISICLAVAAVSFIFSRFVAGMAKQTAWQNLRGGAAYMVGNALIMVAIATGLIFRFFENDSVIQGMAYGIIAFLFLLAVEIVLNFVLNLYRPRIPGEVPRPAFDSKILSLLATPDSLVRSLNEAVNYQFGFDVTSSWGYQLLLRSFVWLIVLAVVALVLMSTMVVVEPYQQALRLRGGAVVGEKVYQSGIMWKLPWPIESALVYDVTKVRSLHLTAKVTQDQEVPLEHRVILWTSSETPRSEGTLDPFLVGSTRLGNVQQEVEEEVSKSADAQVGQEKTAEELQQERAAQIVSNYYSLVEAEVVLQYRIRQDADQQRGGLIDFLHFGTESIARRQSLTDRERALRAVALGEISQHLARLSLDEVLAPGTSDLTKALATRVQAAFDRERAGVEVVAITVPMLRPAAASAPTFEEFGISQQARRQLVAVAEREAYKELTAMIGDVSLADAVLDGIDEYHRLVRETPKGAASPEAIAKRQEVEEILRSGGGSEAQKIAVAERDRWYDLMKTRGQASRWQGELDSYRAAPQLYRQREIMKVYGRLLPNIPKYIIGVDPSRVNVDFDLKNTIPFIDFAGASEEELKK